MSQRFSAHNANGTSVVFRVVVRRALHSYEETSFDITGKANESEYIDAAIHEQRVRLYIVRNVPQETVFAPRTKKEISKIEWHAIDSLPSSKNSSAHKNANHFFTVIPFVSKLRHWIKTQRSSDKRRLTRSTSSAPPASSHPINVIAALRPPQTHTLYGGCTCTGRDRH